MKKWFTVLFLMLALFIGSNSEQDFVNAATNNKIFEKNNVTIIINGETIKFTDPIINNSDHLLLPMRDFYEAIGATVYWNQEEKIASSVRNGSQIDLTINSKMAIVNGQKVTMSVAPLVYKSRTYIPLRFVSENSDGKVYWNQEAQIVDIVLNEENNDGQSPEPGGETPAPSQPEVPEIKPVLYMNNTKIMMNESVVTKDGRIYIPSTYFRDYLKDSSEEWTSSNSLELTVSRLHFVFTNNSNRIYVNGELITGTEKPFIQNEKMYVPVKLIIESFKNGGTLRYIPESKTMYISIYDYILSTDFLEKSYGALKVPQLVGNAAFEGNRELLVSDNPEELLPSIIGNATETLSEYKVQGATKAKEHRVYGWHINKLEDRASIGITIQNTSNSATLEVSGSKGLSQTSSNSWSTFDVGLPLADAVVSNAMLNAKNESFTLAPGESKVVEAYDLGKNYLLGFIHDFDVSTVDGQLADYTIRTVISLDTDTDLASIHSPALLVNEKAAHPRGVWSSSVMKVTLPTYNVDSEQVGYNISNGKTDHLQTAENSIDPMNGTIGNPGHFGMNYKVDIPVVNDTGKLKYVLVKIAGRGGQYSGAVKMNGKSYLIPTLKPGQEFVQLPIFRTSKKTDTIQLEISHAGGSNLPVAVYVETR